MEKEERKRKKGEGKQKKAGDKMREKELKRKQKEEKKQEMEKKKTRKAEKKILRQFHEKMVTDYKEDTFEGEDAALLPTSPSPCCSKDERKSSKRKLEAPENKRVSKRPAKKRFFLGLDDHRSSDVTSLTDICFEC